MYILGDGKDREIIEQEINKRNLSDMIKLIGSDKNPYFWIKNAEILVPVKDHIKMGNSIKELLSKNSNIREYLEKNIREKECIDRFLSKNILKEVEVLLETIK